MINPISATMLLLISSLCCC